jgi:hypothetical protein
MPEEYEKLSNKSYSRESRTNFPGKQECNNRRDPGKSGTGNPGNETLRHLKRGNPSKQEVFWKFDSLRHLKRRIVRFKQTYSSSVGALSSRV